MDKRTTTMEKHAPQSLRTRAVFFRLILVMAVISFVLFILILPLPFRVFNKHAYYDEYAESGVYSLIGRNNSEVITYSLLTFFRCDEKAIQHINSTLHCDVFLQGNYSYNAREYGFSDAEQEHLQDVKHLLQIIIATGYVAFLILLLSLVFLYINMRRKEKRFMPFMSLLTKILFQGSLVLVAVYLLIWLASLNFSAFFDLFHKAFFPMGNYTFDSNSLLITLFPEQFFAHAARWIFLTGFIIATIILTVSFVTHMLIRKKP
jgi:integral membrane protein (TIGR01906 family)